MKIAGRWHRISYARSCGLGIASLAVVLSLSVFSGCLRLKSNKRQPDNDAHDCSGVSCWKPPPNNCFSDDALQVYAPSGYCSGGECSYAIRQEQCHSGICDQGECVISPCQGVFCYDPPEPVCTDANRTIYAPSGYCSGGECSYASKTSACDFLCESGSCTDSPCAEVYCRRPPAPYCQDDKNLVIFEPEGRCIVVEDRPKCLHGSQTIACDHGCKGGRCQDDPCVGVICDRPPARYCYGTELVLFEPYGFCIEGGYCAYIEKRHSCIEPCVDASCGEDDACDNVICNEPPASYCHTESVLRVYSRDGMCEDGFCSYHYSEKDCGDKGCEEGRCKGDPCQGVNCDILPAAYCDGNVAVNFEKKGTCNDGKCTYPKEKTSCPVGCENAECLTDEDTDTGSDTNTDTETNTDADTNTDTDTGTDTETNIDTQCIHPSVVESCSGNWCTIPAGCYWMGSPDGDCPDGYPGGSGTECALEWGHPDTKTEELHKVTLTHSFEMMKYEVTQGEFETVMGGTPNCANWCGASHPVYDVSWFDAVAYANKLSNDGALVPCYRITAVSCEKDDNPGGHNNYMVCYNGNDANKSGGINTATVALSGGATPYDCEGYRLPTEAEWEYAIRAGSHTAFYPSKGNDGSITEFDMDPDPCSYVDPNLSQIGWYCANDQGGTAPVGGKEANAWGLHDMSGNVSEWVWDWFKVFSAAPATNPVGPSSAPFRVLRGGSWVSNCWNGRSAARNVNAPDLRMFDIGFRLARSVP